MLTFRTKMRLSDIEAVRRISSSTKLLTIMMLRLPLHWQKRRWNCSRILNGATPLMIFALFLPSRTVRFALMFAMGGFRIQIRLMSFIGWQQINSFRGRVSAICSCNRLFSSFARPAAAKFILKPKGVPVIIRPMSFITAAVLNSRRV